MQRNICFLFLCLLTASIVNTASGQKSKVIKRDWFAFAQKVSAEAYRGMPFEFEVKVKTIPSNGNSGKAQAWMRIDCNKGRGFFENMDDNPVTTPKWKTCKISGTVDTNAVEFVFGGLCYYNGTFLYDDFSLKVKTSKGWEDVTITNANFDLGTTEGWSSGIGRSALNVEGFSIAVQGKNTAGNSRCLAVTGKNIAAYGADVTKGKYFETNGVKLYYEVYGNGKPLLLLHGNGQSISAMGNQVAYFSKMYKVIIPDCRGRGKSTISDEELTYDIQASDMNNLLTHLTVDSADIIGWSDGGIIALIMAKDYPKKVRRFIASGANVLQDTTVYFPDQYNAFTGYLKDTTHKGIDRRLINLMVKYPSIPFAELGKIKCPALIVAGDNDEIRIGHTVKIYEAIPGAQLFIVPGTSHYVLSENADAFNAAAEKFLRR